MLLPPQALNRKQKLFMDSHWADTHSHLTMVADGVEEGTVAAVAAGLHGDQHPGGILTTAEEEGGEGEGGDEEYGEGMDVVTAAAPPPKAETLGIAEAGSLLDALL